MEDQIQEQVDLEKLRDEKCVPIARGVLNDMAIDMPAAAKSRTDLQPIVMKILQRALDADLNTVTENPYIFQLILKVLSGLSTAVQQCNTTAIDDVRYNAIAKQILSIAATANITMGNMTPEEEAVAFAPVKEQLNALFAAEKLSWLEVKYIMDGIFTSFKFTQQIFSENVEMSVERMEAKILGIDSMGDLGMKRLNEALIAPTAEMPLEEGSRETGAIVGAES